MVWLEEAAMLGDVIAMCLQAIIVLYAILLHFALFCLLSSAYNGHMLDMVSADIRRVRESFSHRGMSHQPASEKPVTGSKTKSSSEICRTASRGLSAACA